MFTLNFGAQVFFYYQTTSQPNNYCSYQSKAFKEGQNINRSVLGKISAFSDKSFSLVMKAAGASLLRNKKNQEDQTSNFKLTQENEKKIHRL